MTAKAGQRFTHAHYLDLEWEPGPGQVWAKDAPKARMIVTSVSQGVVYYAFDERGPHAPPSPIAHMSVAEFDRQYPDPEPPRPEACPNCATTYETCTQNLRAGKGACCSTCRYTATHAQNEWEAWKERQDRKAAEPEAEPEPTTTVVLTESDRGLLQGLLLDKRLETERNVTSTKRMIENYSCCSCHIGRKTYQEELLVDFQAQAAQVDALLASIDQPGVTP